jgi:hypothetical protein
MKKIFRELYRLIIPFWVRRRIRGIVIAPSFYKRMIDECEEVYYARYSAERAGKTWWPEAEARKAAHILDKGLQRDDVSPGHGAQIASSLERNIKLIGGEDKKKTTVVWSSEILEDYNQLQIGQLAQPRGASFVNPEVDYELLFRLQETRRSIRSFKKGALSRESIEKVLDASLHAPHSCNRQAIASFVSMEENMVKKCLGLNNGATGISGQPQAFISFCSDLRCYDLPKEQSLPTLDTALGVQNSVLAAHSLSLGLTLLNWSHATPAQERNLRDLLKIPPYYKIIINAALGLPRKGAPVPVKKTEERFWVEG